MVKERHGIGGLATTNESFANGGGEAITLTDGDRWICITMTDKPLRLSPEQARYLADCLSQAARRVKAASRGEPSQMVSLPDEALASQRREVT